MPCAWADCSLPGKLCRRAGAQGEAAEAHGSGWAKLFLTLVPEESRRDVHYILCLTSWVMTEETGAYQQPEQLSRMRYLPPDSILISQQVVEPDTKHTSYWPTGIVVILSLFVSFSRVL